jgi:hypothetical protein
LERYNVPELLNAFEQDIVDGIDSAEGIGKFLPCSQRAISISLFDVSFGII